MKLKDAIMQVQYDAGLGIYTTVPISADSEARYGQTIFENGGLLDDKEFFANGETCGDFISVYCEGMRDADIDPLDVAAEMIYEMERNNDE